MPNQDRQIYNKQTTEDTKTAKIVAGEEQPIDVGAAARRDGPRVGAAGDRRCAFRLRRHLRLAPPPAIAAQAAKPDVQPTPGVIPGLGEPRRVKTVSVRPDGTIIDGQPASPPPRRPVRG